MAGIPTIKSVQEGDGIEELREHVALLQKMVNYALTGNLGTANLLEVAGWRVEDGQLVAENGLVGLNSQDDAGDDVRIWAGNVDRNTAAFRVHESGRLVATGADISGTIHMTSGEIVWGPIVGPDYDAVTGLKPPRNADNTSDQLIGFGFTRIGANYVYTGTLYAKDCVLGTFADTGSLNLAINNEYFTIRSAYTTGGNSLIIGKTATLGALPSKMERIDIMAGTCYLYDNVVFSPSGGIIANGNWVFNGATVNFSGATVSGLNVTAVFG